MIVTIEFQETQSREEREEKERYIDIDMYIHIFI